MRKKIVFQTDQKIKKHFEKIKLKNKINEHKNRENNLKKKKIEIKECNVPTVQDIS